MKLGSHNTFTYLPVKKWWLKPFKFMAQCQGKTLQEQYDCGVRLFDVRVSFDDNGLAVITHGMMQFSGDVENLLSQMNSLGENVYCRLLNERDENYDLFITFCVMAKKKFQNITFFGGRNKKDWKVIYDFRKTEPKIIDKYSSWNNDTKIGTGWHLDDLFPRIYAIALNKYWRNKLGNDESYLMQDFIGVY